MPNVFKSNLSASVGTTPTAVYTCPAATQTTLIGLSLANRSNSPVTADAYITRSATIFYLICNGVVPVGSSLVVVGGDQKVVLQPGDVLNVVSSAATSVDVVCSLLEIT